MNIKVIGQRSRSRGFCAFFSQHDTRGQYLASLGRGFYLFQYQFWFCKTEQVQLQWRHTQQSALLRLWPCQQAVISCLCNNHSSAYWFHTTWPCFTVQPSPHTALNHTQLALVQQLTKLSAAVVRHKAKQTTM